MLVDYHFVYGATMIFEWWFIIQRVTPWHLFPNCFSET